MLYINRLQFCVCDIEPKLCNIIVLSCPDSATHKLL